MSLVRLALRNAGRTKVRAALTVLAVAISLVSFLLLRSVSAGWTRQVEQTPNNRVVARHRVGWSQLMPVHYRAEIAAIPGIKQAMGARWAELRVPGRESTHADVTAVHAQTFVDMHYELVAPPDQKAAFATNRRGLWASEAVARDLGWQVGDNVFLKDIAFGGLLEFEVSGLFESARHGFAQRSIWIHWEYYNETLPLEERDKIHIVSAEVFEPARSATLAKAVDVRFDSQDIQTFTQDDQALNASLVGMAGALLRAMDVVSVLILGIVVLIIGNTVAMAVRERTPEYAVLRALGFGSWQLGTLVSLEAVLLGVLGGALGVLLAYPLVESGLTRYLTETMEMAPLEVPYQATLAALGSSAALALLAAALPAYRTTRLEVCQALRHLG
jgi:putative ABC transport system permease protein